MLLNPLNYRLSEEKMNCSNLLGEALSNSFFMLRTDHEKSGNVLVNEVFLFFKRWH